MRYLKDYKLFESSIGELELEIKDILRDVSDSGHRLDITIHEFSDYDRLDVFITFLDESGNQSSVNLKEYTGSIGHLISKLESEDWNVSSSWMILDNEVGKPSVFKLGRAVELKLDERTYNVKRIELRFDKFK
jgi:hypothetical protein